MNEILGNEARELCKDFFDVINMPRYDDGASVWTARVLETFRKMGHRRGFNVLPDKNARGEYLVDLIWTNWEIEFCLGDEFKDCYWNELVLESEWGAEYNVKNNYSAIMDDFSKIVDVKARFKVMVFGYHYEDDKKKILSDMVCTLKHYKWILPEEVYLFFAFPWKKDNFIVEGPFWDGTSDMPTVINRVKIRVRSRFIR